MPDKMLLRDRLVLDPAHGTFDFVFHAQTILQNATAQVTYRDARGQSRVVSFAGEKLAYGIAENRVTVSQTDGAVELVWNAVLGDESTIWIEVTNRSREPLLLDELRVLSLDVVKDPALSSGARGARVNLGASPRQWRFFQNGWQSWSAAFGRAADNGVHADPNTDEYRVKHQPHAIPIAPKTLASEWFTVISPVSLRAAERRSNLQSNEEIASSQSFDSAEFTLSNAEGLRSGSLLAMTPSLLLGFITTAEQLSEIRLQLDGVAFVRLDATAFADGVRVEPGEKLASEKLLLAFDADPNALLERYAARLGETMHARIPASPLTGWCTWYYFFGENTERDVIANLERVRAERLPLDVILIDDGYQTSDGDWTSVTAEKFPHGMKWLADEIKRAGCAPGVWLAPFAANENSQLAREHPEFLLRDATGAPVCSWIHWGAKCFSLDLARADVQDWLRGLFRTLSDDWGYELFKLDFTYTAAAPGVRADPKMTRAQALRRGFEIIRETIGDKKILGCGAPLGPSVGLVDAMRMGPDVSINWEPFFHGDPTEPSTAYAMRNTLTRAFLHNRLWQNDPDCVLVRRRDDESALVLNEMRTMVSIIGLSGGAVLSSDNLPSIRRGRLKYLKQILPPTGQTARAVDLFENELPQLFALPAKTDWGEWMVVGAINWDDKTTHTEIALEALGLDPRREYHVYNYWHRRYLGVARERVKIARHQPHETRVLLFKLVADRVELLTTTFHIAQGLCEVKRVERREETRASKRRTQTNVDILKIEMEKKGWQRGEVLFAIPKGRKVIAARVDGRVSPHRSVDKGIIVVGLALDERAVVEIETSASLL
ncbi:MAG: alpha-galactosidase [Chloroflexota bacterium]|nr:alpha-galactosidase [Chloroflexota bacterium]